jgi:mannose PTS system EIID component
MTAPTSSAPATSAPLPMRTRARMFGRLFSIQASWNYEVLVGTGLGYCVEPALRDLAGGMDGPAYRDALARECRYFNSHPYLAAVAVGALARVELEGVAPERIERFRTALCGPLGGVGDRLVWAGWLPLCSLLALAAYGLGMGPAGTVALFLGLYNVGHISLRAWGLGVGSRCGLAVASALGRPTIRNGPTYIARVAAFVAGFALPVTIHQMLGPGKALLSGVVAGILVGALLLAWLRRRHAAGWVLTLLVLTAFTIYAVTL